jgi:hypothetical protein
VCALHFFIWNYVKYWILQCIQGRISFKFDFLAALLLFGQSTKKILLVSNPWICSCLILLLQLWFQILDHNFCFKNDHFLLEKPDNLNFHKNLKDFFCLFHGTTFENTLLVADMLHKSMFNPPCNAIFFETFYECHIDGNYLSGNIILYLESSHSAGMWVYKFVELNPFGSIMNMSLGGP